MGREWQERGGAWGSAMCSVGAKVGRERRGKCEWRGRGGDFYKTCVGFVGERSALPLWLIYKLKKRAPNERPYSFILNLYIIF